MNENFDLQSYLSEGIENFMKDVLKATMKNPRESAFMLKFAAATAAASKKRKAAEAAGEHIPSFLIASITGFPYREHYFPVQSSLCRVLLTLQQSHSRCRACKPAYRRRMAENF